MESKKRPGRSRGRALACLQAMVSVLVAVLVAVAIGAGEAAIEDVRAARFPFGLEQGAVSALFPPGVCRFGGGEIELHLVVNGLHPAAGNTVVDAAGIGVASGQDDAVAAGAIDGTDMGIVRAAQLHI